MTRYILKLNEIHTLFQEHERERNDGLDPLDLDTKAEMTNQQQQYQQNNGQTNNYGTIPNGEGDTKYIEDNGKCIHF